MGQIGVHGIVIKFTDDRGAGFSATFLPEVAAEQGVQASILPAVRRSVLTRCDVVTSVPRNTITDRQYITFSRIMFSIDRRFCIRVPAGWTKKTTLTRLVRKAGYKRSIDNGFLAGLQVSCEEGGVRVVNAPVAEGP